MEGKNERTEEVVLGEIVEGLCKRIGARVEGKVWGNGLKRGTEADDSVAKALVKGGAIDLEQPIVHPALSELDAKVIDELRDALLTGWKTDEDRVLAKYLQDL